MAKAFYISKNYRSNTSAAGKAKIDCEKILENAGCQNIGLKQSINSGGLYNFIRNLATVIVARFRMKRGSTVILQYPFKKYYPFLCRIARSKNCRTVTIIHDLRSHRKGKVTVAKEIKQLNVSSILIVHNESMKKWLTENGSQSQLICLGIFDYLSEAMPESNIYQKPYEVVFAGVLSNTKNSFIYKISARSKNFKLNIYGRGEDREAIANNPALQYKGFFNADELIAKIKGHFGLVWDGNDITTCSGNFGEYLKYNNPHKTSLYIRCHLPVIIWSQAAISKFIVENNIGIAIDSLEQLDQRLSEITEQEYQIMLSNTQKVASRLKDGFYLQQALNQII